MTMKIHNFARGARGQRVMWLCEEMGLAYAVQNHSFPVGADYRALNPLGTVPFLEDAGVFCGFGCAGPGVPLVLLSIVWM